eukprot:177250-Rhodomonas_salina.1
MRCPTHPSARTQRTRQLGLDTHNDADSHPANPPNCKDCGPVNPLKLADSQTHHTARTTPN